MAKVVYIEHGGSEHVIDVPEGWTVMQGAINNDIDGIKAECGGACSCGTCHVYVDEASLARLPEISDNEVAMLDEVAAEVKPTSRLCCQIEVTAALDGLVVQMPATQG